MSADGNNLGDARDDVLVKRAKDGDQDAFGILFLRYREKVYGCLMSIVCSDEAAKDLCQDTYIQAWKSIKSLNEPLSFKAWLVTIAKHLAFDWRKQKSRKWIVGSLEEDGSPSDPIDRNADPQVEIVGREYIRDVLAEMEPTLRNVLILNAVGCERDEIARQLGYTEGTVVTYLANARKQFRQLYFSLIDRTDATRKDK